MNKCTCIDVWCIVVRFNCPGGYQSQLSLNQYDQVGQKISDYTWQESLALSEVTISIKSLKLYKFFCVNRFHKTKGFYFTTTPRHHLLFYTLNGNLKIFTHIYLGLCLKKRALNKHVMLPLPWRSCNKIIPTLSNNFHKPAHRLQFDTVSMEKL